jgi:hypothetical protein
MTFFLRRSLFALSLTAIAGCATPLSTPTSSGCGCSAPASGQLTAVAGAPQAAAHPKAPSVGCAEPSRGITVVCPQATSTCSTAQPAPGSGSCGCVGSCTCGGYATSIISTHTGTGNPIAVTWPMACNDYPISYRAMPR